MNLEIKSKDDLDIAISNKNLTAVEFWAPWCIYCKQLQPIFESVSNEYSDIKFIDINIENQNDVVAEYGIRGVPVIKFYCESKEISEITGYVPLTQLRKEIERVIEIAPSCQSSISLLK